MVRDKHRSWKATIKLAGLELEPTTLEGHNSRWPAVSKGEEEDCDPDPRPAAHCRKDQCLGAVAASPGHRVEKLER